MSSVLVVEDDAQMRTLLARYLARQGHVVFGAPTLAEGRALQAKEAPDLIIVDYNLPDGTAFDLLGSRQEQDGAEAVIVLTGVGTIDLAVHAIKLGAEHFLTKPVDIESLGVLVQRTLEAQRDRRQRALAAAAAQDTANPFLGTSRRIRELRELAEALLDSDAPVLLQGETGCGKGVMARWLHANSSRKDEAFVDLNCAGLSLELVESELFGHRRGAFTGAVNNKPGLLEVAHRGTLFLDEIGDLELGVQPKLLKALEEGSFRRVGDHASRSADVRLIAATHKNLGAMAQQEKFRGDLLFRINTLVLEIPPLRERDEDLRATTKRHPAIFRIRSVVSDDGTLLEWNADAIFDGGAYNTLTPVVLSRGVLHVTGPYRCENVHIHGVAVATNTPPNGAFRGFGAPQAMWAVTPLGKWRQPDPYSSYPESLSFAA